MHKAKPLPRSESENGKKRDKKAAQGETTENEAAEDMCNWICALSVSITNEASHLTRKR
jgi:hypothetical protein